MASFTAGDPAGICSTSKFAVRDLTEALRAALAKYDIGVSVLCPSNVNTNIAESALTGPEHLKKSGYQLDEAVLVSLRTLCSAGMDPVALAEHVRRHQEERALYHPVSGSPRAVEGPLRRDPCSAPTGGSDGAGVVKRQAAMTRFVQERQER